MILFLYTLWLTCVRCGYRYPNCNAQPCPRCGFHP